jgi:hypothetical protein
MAILAPILIIIVDFEVAAAEAINYFKILLSL